LIVTVDGRGRSPELVSGRGWQPVASRGAGNNPNMQQHRVEENKAWGLPGCIRAILVVGGDGRAGGAFGGNWWLEKWLKNARNLNNTHTK